MATKILWRNIVILPPKEIADQAREMSKQPQLEWHIDTNFLLNNAEHLPHLTLHQFAIPAESEPALIDAVKRVTVAWQSGELAITMLDEIGIFCGSGIFWNAKREQQLWNLHCQLVAAIVPLQKGYIIGDHAAFVDGRADSDEAMRESLHRYGNLTVNLDAPEYPFWPHMTLTSCKRTGDAQMIKQKAAPPRATYTTRSIHLTAVGPNGTCPGSLQEFPLGA